jgi:hypothetical protein
MAEQPADLQAVRDAAERQYQEDLGRLAGMTPAAVAYIAEASGLSPEDTDIEAWLED